MFDKEVKKEANKRTSKIYRATDYDDDNASYLADVENYRRGFKDGAGFGFNKCKEELDIAKEIIEDLLNLESKIDWSSCSFEEQEDIQTDIDIAKRFLSNYLDEQE